MVNLVASNYWCFFKDNWEKMTRLSNLLATTALILVTSPALAEGPTVLNDEELDQVVGGLLYLGTDHNSVILPTDVDLIGKFADHAKGLTCFDKGACTNKTGVITWGKSLSVTAAQEYVERWGG